MRMLMLNGKSKFEKETNVTLSRTGRRHQKVRMVDAEWWRHWREFLLLLAFWWFQALVNMCSKCSISINRVAANSICHGAERPMENITSGSVQRIKFFPSFKDSNLAHQDWLLWEAPPALTTSQTQLSPMFLFFYFQLMHAGPSLSFVHGGVGVEMCMYLFLSVTVILLYAIYLVSMHVILPTSL